MTLEIEAALQQMRQIHAWCSVCHLKADAQLHASRATQTKKQRKHQALEAAGQLTLFGNLLE
jgi:hypothetical protein